MTTFPNKVHPKRLLPNTEKRFSNSQSTATPESHHRKLVEKKKTNPQRNDSDSNQEVNGPVLHKWVKSRVRSRYPLKTTLKRASARTVVANALTSVEQRNILYASVHRIGSGRGRGLELKDEDFGVKIRLRCRWGA